MALLGTTQKELKNLAKKENADVSRIIRNLKKKQNKNFKWKLEEGKGGSIKLYSVNFATPPSKSKSSKKEKPAKKEKSSKKTKSSKKDKSTKKTKVAKKKKSKK